MILVAYGQDAPTVTELLHLGQQRNSFTDRGLIHASLAGLATDLGVPARAEAVDLADVLARLADAPMIVSVTEQLPDDGRRGGHLIVLRGCSNDADPPTVHFRDPSAWGQTHDQVPVSRIAASYTGRAITFAPLTGRLP